MMLRDKLSTTVALIGFVLLSACSGETDTSKTSADRPALDGVQINDRLGPPQTQDIVINMDEWISSDPIIQKIFNAAKTHDVAYEFTKGLTTEIGPRLGGSDAEARARKWTEARFQAAGLENVRTESFVIKGWNRRLEGFEVNNPFPQKMYVTALGGSVATPRGGVTADIAYFPTFEDLEKSPEGGLDGKIVFISGLMEKFANGAGYGPANQKRRRGASEASKRGALAVVIRSVGTDSHRFPHTGQMNYQDGIKPIPIGALSAPDADQLERILQRAGDEAVSTTLNLQTRALGDVQSGNVIGELIGSEKPDEIIVIGGHLDSWDQGTGAVDDGIGVGITFGALKLLQDIGLQPKRTIRMVAFGSEEVGLLGARVYAKKHADSLSTHYIASESDFGAGPIYELQGGVTDAANAEIDKIALALKPLGVKRSSSATTGGPDIIPMNAQGVPAIRLQQNGYDYFDLHHTPDDTFDKIKPDDVAQNVAAWATMLWMLSESETDFRPDNADSK
ncbi:MAG: M20/M25/M40 family metallo-hydrolase [Maricaulaceae bacterium]